MVEVKLDTVQLMDVLKVVEKELSSTNEDPQNPTKRLEVVDGVLLIGVDLAEAKEYVAVRYEFKNEVADLELYDIFHQPDQVALSCIEAIHEDVDQLLVKELVLVVDASESQHILVERLVVH